MPSPTSTTVPTLRVSTPESNESIADLMMLVISSERMAMCSDLLEGARNELVPQSLEAASDASVDQAVADPHDQAAQQAGIGPEVELDAAAGQLFHPRGDSPDLVRAQRRGACCCGKGDALTGVVETSELGSDAGQLLNPATPEHQPDQVEDGAADDLAEDGLGHLGTGVEGDCRVRESP